MLKIGAELRAYRFQLGLSQAKLSQLSSIPQSVLSSFELGKTSLTECNQAQLSAALGNLANVHEIIARRKRITQAVYSTPIRLKERIAKTARTEGNAVYVQALNLISTSHAKPKPAEAPTAISLFSGVGGFSLGFSAAGFRVLGCLEISDDLRSVYRQNFPGTFELGGNIREVSDSLLTDFHKKVGSVDVVIGGPPCQGFSLSGKRDVDDPRNVLFKDYLKIVRKFRPKVAILENVRLLTSMKAPTGVHVKDAIAADFRAEGYRTKLFEVNAKDYGVPQHRERVFFVAVREDLGIEPSLPQATHGERGGDLFLFTPPERTFGDAVSDLPFLESGEKGEDPLHAAVAHPAHVIKWLWDVPQGSSAHDNEDHALRPPSGYNTTYKRQVWDEPGATVQTTSAMISGCRNVHPIATRSLTIREAARLQSFPDEYKFPTTGVSRTGIGNAVPPLLALEIAKHVRKQAKL
jgi:DNA (cytosine-5)-methyltransferase 1